MILLGLAKHEKSVFGQSTLYKNNDVDMNDTTCEF